MSKKICSKCGCIGDEKRAGCVGCLGLIVVQLVCVLGFLMPILMPFFLVINFLYLLYFVIVNATSYNKRYCPRCKNENSMVPLDSPGGHLIKNQYHKTDEE